MENNKFYFDKTINTVIVTYDDYIPADEFKEISEKLNTFRINNHAIKQLNNIEQIGVLSEEIRLWLHDTWLPKAFKTGLKFIAFVTPKNAFGKWSLNEVTKDKTLFNNIEIKYFSTFDEAKNWLKEK